MRHVHITISALFLILVTLACDKPEPTLEEPASSAATTEDAVPDKAPAPKDTPSPEQEEKAPEQAPATGGDEAVYIEKLERLTETCAKLEQPTHDACVAFQKRIAAKDPGALKDLDTVLGGSRVAQPNMVYLEEQVAAMLVDKYGNPEDRP